MSEATLGWLAADYHLPATYSCRPPLSSANSALISPAPGPATVRLALIRASLELFGRDVVRDSLFPWIRAARVLIRPPERVAISGQVLRAYKADEDKGRVAIGESVIYREVAHAEGVMTVYLEISLEERNTWETLLRNIGYWGQASSFATCLEVSECAPETNECAQPLQAVGGACAAPALLFLHPLRVSRLARRLAGGRAPRRNTSEDGAQSPQIGGVCLAPSGCDAGR